MNLHYPRQQRTVVPSKYVACVRSNLSLTASRVPGNALFKNSLALETTNNRNFVVNPGKLILKTQRQQNTFNMQTSKHTNESSTTVKDA